MEWLFDPTVWVGLLTLVFLEIVLGIDNLIFIAILADKLPSHQRDKARLLGLSLAMLMRLGLLTIVSWLVTLTTPLFSLGPFKLSGRDLILLLGGLFLLFKATVELHERLEGVVHTQSESKAYASFAAVVAQIVVLDAVFSLDAVITAVGMVEELWVMMAAVVISIGIMILASKPLTRFVNAHPTVVVLCLSFLLMIGLSLVAEGLGFHIPKGYLYAAIGFSVVIEALNQFARRNLLKSQARVPFRARTAESVLRLLGNRKRAELAAQAAQDDAVDGQPVEHEVFAVEERNMVSGVLTLADRSLRSIITPRSDMSWTGPADADRHPGSDRRRIPRRGRAAGDPQAGAGQLGSRRRRRPAPAGADAGNRCAAERGRRLHVAGRLPAGSLRDAARGRAGDRGGRSALRDPGSGRPAHRPGRDPAPRCAGAGARDLSRHGKKIYSIYIL